MGMIGFCTAPSRDNAATRTKDSIHVGSSHETLLPRVTPMRDKPAATRSAEILYSRKVRLVPNSSTAMEASGVASARSSTSSQSVLPVTARSEGEDATRQFSFVHVGHRRLEPFQRICLGHKLGGLQPPPYGKVT